MTKASDSSTDRSSHLRRLFADISPRYDFLNRLLSLGVDVSWRRRAIQELRLPPGAMILDICTGTADLAIEASKALEASRGAEALASPPGALATRGPLVIGADFAPEMVKIAAQKRARRGVGALRLIVADALRLPFRDGSFDAVMAAFGVRNLVDLERGLCEMFRVLKPGGQALILEFSRPSGSLFGFLFQGYFHRILPRLGGWISGSRTGPEAYSYLPRSVEGFPAPEALSRMLKGCGFGLVRYRAFTRGIATLHLACRPKALDSAPTTVAGKGTTTSSHAASEGVSQ